MRRAAVAIALLAVLTGCGDDGGTSGPGARDPADPPTTEPPGTTPAPPEPPEVVAIVSAPASGEEASTEVPTVLDDARALADYVAALGSGALGEEVTRVVEAHRPSPGRVLAAAVVAVGCDVPRDATVTERDGGFVVVPAKVAGAPQQCYVPVASVAVVELPG